MNNIKDEYVMVPLRKDLANSILDFSNSLSVGPVEILNSGVEVMVNTMDEKYKKNVLENKYQDNSSDKLEVAEELSPEEARDVLLEELKKVIKTAHTVEININYK